jgi:hypothetical protein
VSQHLPQGANKICNFVKNSDLWADIWMWGICKITSNCLLPHLRTTPQLNKWMYIYIYIYHLELGWCSQYSDHATNCKKLGSKCGRGRRIFPRTFSPAPASSYSEGIGVYFPRIKRLRRETATYHDPNRFWNPNYIVNLKFVLFDKSVWLNKPRISSAFLSKNARSFKNFKMLQLLRDIHNFQRSRFKLQNSIYVFDWNILVFRAFVVSCFGQWMMSLHVENMYRGLNRIFLVPVTLQSYTSLGLSYTEIVSWFADQLVCSCRTSLYVNMVGGKMF